MSKDNIIQESNCENDYNDLMEEFNAILNSSADGIHITDGKGVTLKFNKSCERIDGVKAEYIIGKNMEELVAEGIYSESVALAVIKEKKQISMLQQVNGKEVIGTGTPIFKNGQLYRIVINSRDITELRRLKEDLNEMELINEKYQEELQIMSSNDKAVNDNIIYNSNKMDNIIELALRVAKVDSTVLIQGESGVGKGVLSYFIHKNSLRSGKPFIKVNCGAIPETLVESELFGYEKGSFTGASSKGKVGLFQLADEGTLFLDEIGELSLNSQVKLLNVIQNKELTRVGGTSIIPINVRIIAATNRNLVDMIKNKTFREDLYYRLNVIPVEIPPLRDRREDLAPLILHFVSSLNKKYNYNKEISSEAMNVLLNYDWPGNVREIENLIERLIVITKASIINRKDLMDLGLIPIDDNIKFEINEKDSYKNIITEYEKKLLLDLMNSSKSTSEMAEKSGLDTSTIRKKFKRFNMKLEF